MFLIVMVQMFYEVKDWNAPFTKENGTFYFSLNDKYVPLHEWENPGENIHFWFYMTVK